MSKKSLERTAAAPALGTRSDRFQCVAHGCPVVAGIVHAGDSPETYRHICRFHDGRPVGDWQRITRVMRERAGLARIADLVATCEIHDIPGWGERVTAYCERIGFPELAPDRARHLPHGHLVDEVKSPKAYAARLSGALSRMIGASPAAVPPPTTRCASRAGRSIGEILGEIVGAEECAAIVAESEFAEHA